MGKRVALLLYGHMRTYEKCFPSLKRNIIDVFKPDVFVHTWSENEARTGTWHNSHMNVFKFTEKNKKNIKKLYKPKNILFENQMVRDYKTTCPNNNLNSEGQKFMIYSFFRANKLKKEYEKNNNFEYDMVIKIRPDIFLKKSFQGLSNNFIMKNNHVYIAGNKVKHGSKLECYRALDIINVCNSSTMDRISNIYNNFDKFYMKTDFDHSAFIDYLLKNKINIKILNYNYGSEWSIHRSPKAKK